MEIAAVHAPFAELAQAERWAEVVARHGAGEKLPWAGIPDPQTLRPAADDEDRPPPAKAAADSGARASVVDMGAHRQRLQAVLASGTSMKRSTQRPRPL